ALAVTTDVSDAAQVDALGRAATGAFGRIHVWINNVGIGALGYFWEVPTDVHARVVDVNLTGLMYGCHVALNHFNEQGGGTLVNTGSVDSEIPIALQNSYAATKAGVLSLGRSLNTELRLAERHETIKVATVMPWAADTPWFEHAANYTGHAPRMILMDDPQLVVDTIVKACTDPKEEMPAGLKAHGAVISHKLTPDLTERLSGAIFKREMEKGTPVPVTQGTVFEPDPKGRTVEGDVRERMAREDAA
ncbi:MAG: SDR family NAD(P)-dependent oxidoreductase, partial [Litorimonas sp.]